MKSMREQILEVSERLFMSQGYKKTSTRQIAEILGITQPNLYYHFKKKEDIYVAIMESLSEEVYHNLENIRKTEDSTMEKLHSMLLYLHKRHPFDFNTMIHDINYNLSKEVGEKLFRLWKKSYHQPFMSLLESREDRLRKNIDIGLAVHQLFVLLSRYMEPDWEKKNIDEDLNKALDMFLYGILE